MRKKNKLSIMSFIVLLFVLTATYSCKPTISEELLPTLTTSEATLTTQNTAKSGGNITSDNGFEVTARGVCWSLNPNPTVNDSLTIDAAGTGAFISSIKNLLANTNYYVRAYATNKKGTGYGTQVTFKTLPTVLPEVTTTATTDINATTAISGGNITFNGGSTITARGICWSMTPNPTIANDKTLDGSATGVFISNLSNLQTGKTYYVKAYATNSAGTAYGSQISFTTLSTPIVTTLSISYKTTTIATSSSTVISDGGTLVTARGVCWSTTESPTISNDHTTDGNGIGTFSSSLSGLTMKATYYVRAYAINNLGVSYGNQVSFVHQPPTSVTDIDGNVYQTVTIGTQIWMASNLRVTHYRNGESITNLTTDTDWSSTTSGAWSDYSNLAANGIKYGHLYNWYAANDSRNIAPVGWHVPTDAEWSTLITYLGGESVAGGKLKEAGTLNWQTPNTAATNATGFTALPGGHRYGGGSFYNLGVYGNWWLIDANNTWFRNMNYNVSNVSRTGAIKGNGYSVRCLLD